MKGPTARTDTYQSVVGSALLDPIFELINGLEIMQAAAKPNQVQAAPRVYGQAAAIVVLTGIWLESALDLSRLITGYAEENARTYFRKAFPHSPLRGQLDELIALRDVVAHSHVWEGRYFFVGMKWTRARNNPKLLPGYGDKNFRAVHDKKTNTTKLLRLNVIPTKLSLEDVRVYVKAAAAVVAELRDWHRKNDNVLIAVGTNRHFVFRGALTPFKRAVDAL